MCVGLSVRVCGFECACVWVFLVCVCVSLCMREREIERERVCVCVCVLVDDKAEPTKLSEQVFPVSHIISYVIDVLEV